MVNTAEDEVCLYETMFRASFTLPLSSIVQKLLNHLNLAPHQIMPNRRRYFFACMVLWPCVLGEEQPLTVREFLKVYRLTKNPRTDALFTFQFQKKVKFIHLWTTFSSNKKWKNSFFFASGSWEFSPLEAIQGPRVPRETSVPSTEGQEDPDLTKEEEDRVEMIPTFTWVKKNEKQLDYDVLVIMANLEKYLAYPQLAGWEASFS